MAKMRQERTLARLQIPDVRGNAMADNKESVGEPNRSSVSVS